MKTRILLNVYKFWSRPWGFHRFYRGLTPDTYAGWQFGLYFIGIEHIAGAKERTP